MGKTISETIEFMERLRSAFPCDKNIDPFGDYVRCNVREVSEKLNMPTKEVWEYVSAACNAHLIDNNGGDLRFNNSLFEDAAEMKLIDAFHQMEKRLGHMPIGFFYKVIRNMYRNDNFCAGKLGDMHRIDSIPVDEVIAEIAKWTLEKGA